MITYEYECPHCGVFEWPQSIKDDALTTCPLLEIETATPCGEPVKRLISGGAYIGGIPEYMSDRNIESRKNQREWLKTPEAKAMDLVPCRDS